ncbi:MAG: ACT domain-containing protein [Chloroflexi bacterium]|nr:ACT domain-containing protein [Chloroflexota bacterium]
MPDRPGALSAISAALAAHGVDIVRLDVVSHEGPSVVDDLFLAAETPDDIGRAVGSFLPDVTVRTFDGTAGDPAVEMGEGLARCVTAGTLEACRGAAVLGAQQLARGDGGAFLRAAADGGVDVLHGPAGLVRIAPEEPFAGRWALQHGSAMAFPVNETWAPAQFEQALGAAWIAIAPCGPFDVLMVVRRLNIAFFTGELERLGAFARAAGAILQLRGDRPAAAALAAGLEGILPERAVTLDQRVAVGS